MHEEAVVIRGSPAFRNALYGALFGGAFPLVGTMVEAALRGAQLSPASLLAAQAGQPLLWIIDSAPFVLAACGWLIGRREQEVIDLHAEAARKRVGEEIDRFLTLAPDPLCILRFDGAFLHVSHGFTAVLGYTLADLEGIRSIDLVHAADRPDAEDRISRLWAGERMSGFVVRTRTKAGEYRWLQWSAIPVLEEKVAYMVGRDVTDERAAKLELEDARDAARDASRAKSEFLANMSHELKTPMNGVLGMTALVLDTSLSVQQRDFVQAVDDSARSLLDIINDLLDFSQMETGRLALSPRDFELSTLLRDPIDTLAARATEKGVALRYEQRGEWNLALIGDPSRVRQIVLNLVDNAVKFTPSGEVVVRTAVERVAEGRARISVSVRDTGIGFDEAARTKIFEAFAQADGSSTRQYGGTGLGLTISWRLAKMMGGDLSAESSVGVGSTFRFDLTLPVAPATAGVVPVRVAGSGDAGSASAAASLRALLVEDNPVNQMLAAALLSKAGYEVTLANNGVEAVARFLEDEFDFVLMDVQVPEMDGLEATRRIREIETRRLKRVPIIAVTAHGMKGDRERCLTAGMDDYVEKPVAPEQLYAAIERSVLTPLADFLPTRALELIGSEGDLLSTARDFLRVSPTGLAAARLALERLDGEELGRSAHSLEGAAARLAMPRLRAIAHEIAVRCNRGEVDQAASLMDELESAFNEGTQAVRRETDVA